MPHAQTWDETAPNGATTAASDIDLVIRNLKVAIRERLVELGVTDFSTADPTRFELVRFENGAYIAITGAHLAFVDSTGTTINMQINDDGNVSVRASLTVGSTLTAALANITGLLTATGGITVPAGQSALFNGPVTLKDSVTLDTGQSANTPVFAVTTSAAHTLDLSQGNIQHLLLNHSPTLTLSNPIAGAHYRIQLKQDGTGSRTVTWPASVVWPNAGSTPAMSTTAGRTDVFGLYYDGTNFLGQVIAYGYNV